MWDSGLAVASGGVEYAWDDARWWCVSSRLDKSMELLTLTLGFWMTPYCLYVSSRSSSGAAAKMARLHSVKTCRSYLDLAADCRSQE
jgi:hypothetical protein